MARIQKLESDSSFNSAKVPENQILVYTVYNQDTNQVYHRAKLANNSVVTVGQQQTIQNAITYYSTMPQASFNTVNKAVVYTGATGSYIKGHTYQCIQSGNTYTWLDITPTVQIQNITSALQGQGISYIVFNSADTQGAQISVTFNYLKAPVGLYTNSGNYYPIEKSSVQMDFTQHKVKVILNPYLTYDNKSSFQGNWICFFAGDAGQGTSSQVISSIQQQLSNKMPWPTNSKIPGYVLRASSNSIGVVWDADPTILLASVFSNMYDTLSNAQQFTSAATSGFTQVNSTLAASYYTKAATDIKLSSYITSDSLDWHLSSKIDMPNSNVVPGYVLTKATSGVLWKQANTGDAFVSSSYYNSTQINTLLSSKISYPGSDFPAGWTLATTGSGVEWRMNSFHPDLVLETWGVNLKPKSNAGNGGWVDFRYNGTPVDYTCRIIQYPEHRLLVVASSGLYWTSQEGTSSYRFLDQRDKSSFTSINIVSSSTAPANPTQGTIWIS